MLFLKKHADEKKLNFNLYHPKLKLKYKKVGENLHFEDGVIYNKKEVSILRGKDCFDHKTVHNAKKIFCGVIQE